MDRNRRGACLLILLGLTACGYKVPVVGLDENDHATVQYVGASDSGKALIQLANESQQSVLHALAKKEPKEVDQQREKFGLHTVLIGIGFVGGFGVGALSFEVTPKIRFAFSDREVPALP